MLINANENLDNSAYAEGKYILDVNVRDLIVVISSKRRGKKLNKHSNTFARWHRTGQGSI